MNKKEISEIKKQLTPANCNITRMAACFVTSEKDIIPQEPSAFLSLPEEETFKYFDLYRKSLSGTIGKNLFNTDFSNRDNVSQQRFLNSLRKSKLEAHDMLDSFYQLTADTYDCTDDYLIILIHGMYDIPGKASDGQDMFDASEEVYEYIHCLICPVSLSKPGLSYDKAKNSIQDRIRDRIVDMPMNGFLFPAFNDRGTDVNALLFYSNKPANAQYEYLCALCGRERPVCNEEKAHWLQAAVDDASMVNPISLSQAQDLFDTYAEFLVENDTDELTLDATDMKKLTEKAGLDEEQVSIIEESFKKELGKSVQAEGFLDTRQLVIKTPVIQLKVDPGYSDSVSARMIEGRPCLVIALTSNEAEVNGLTVRLIERRPPVSKTTE